MANEENAAVINSALLHQHRRLLLLRQSECGDGAAAELRESECEVVCGDGACV